VGSTYGPSSILLSPALGWLPMLSFAWLQLSWVRGGGGAAAAAAAVGGGGGVTGRDVRL